MLGGGCFIFVISRYFKNMHLWLGFKDDTKVQILVITFSHICIQKEHGFTYYLGTLHFCVAVLYNFFLAN